MNDDLYDLIENSQEENQDNKLVKKKTFNAWKPKTSHLIDAVDENGNFLLSIKDRLIVEYPDEWRSTLISNIKKIKENGDVWLYDLDNAGWAFTNYIVAKERGLKLKIPDDHKKWKSSQEVFFVNKRKKE